MSIPPVVACQYREDLPQAEQRTLFDRLGLRPDAGAEFLMGFHAGRLSLWQNAARAPEPTCVDFGSAAMQYRLRTSGRRQGLARAVGLHRRQGLTVVDATAGLGRDAFILAALGCQVILLERSPLVHALLEDGLSRAAAASDTRIREVVSRMTLYNSDALEWLSSGPPQTGPLDALYLDPMFPERRKSASVKKDMASLQRILGADADTADLLQVALDSAASRVVVKRPVHFGESQADFRVTGKSSRFDVYLNRRDRTSA